MQQANPNQCRDNGYAQLFEAMRFYVSREYEAMARDFATHVREETRLRPYREIEPCD